MATRRIESPPEGARTFVQAMHAYFAEADPIKADEIAVLQLRSLQHHYKATLRLGDIKRIFAEMRGHLSC
ncbi:conserved hypothetical protein [Bradyrhizobium sp. STM 3843]|uniref:hypothetical protein n=1 Tax=Bradyrhizobium sp. STM 3843 TaxID=551947 RepID=UPI00024077EE|nr:hypothetical protein [Bradyrhizobium sp. STM 3843]CCE07439.1 conserved hypothetical protein [Bradyrhizobium sp. STM 3843]